MNTFIKKVNISAAVILIITYLVQTTVFASPLILGSASESPFEDTAKVPILMYHKLTTTNKITNKWTITPEEFEEDLIYIKENGYETVVMSDLIDFVHNGGKLPEKPIVLTFDDGDIGVYLYAYPLLEKYNMKAVISIIGKVTDEYSEGGPDDVKRYPHLTWTQINKMLKSGCIELQNHSYDLHHDIGAKKKKGESESDYRIRLTSDLNNLQTRISDMTSAKPNTFVYPFGAVSNQSKEIIRELGFSASLGCYDSVNKITTGKPDCLFNMGRTLRPHGYTASKVFKKLKNDKKMAVS